MQTPGQTHWQALQLDHQRKPKLLYRIIYSNSATNYSAANGFTSLSQRLPQTDSDFHKRSSHHLNWRTNESSIFISTYDDVYEAMQRAASRETNHYSGSWSIAIIDTSLIQTLIYRAVQLIDYQTKITLGLGLFSHEYLILHQIPAAAILDIVPQDELDCDCAFVEDCNCERILHYRVENGAVMMKPSIHDVASDDALLELRAHMMEDLF